MIGTMTLEPLLTGVSLAGFAIGLIGGELTPVTWQYRTVASATETTATIWTHRSPPGKWEATTTSSVKIPAAMSASFAISGDKVHALLAMNTSEPASLWQWNLADMQRPNKIVEARLQTTIALDEEIVSRIKLTPDETWSTFGIPPERWVFSPSVTVNEQTQHLRLSLNSLRGQGQMWNLDPAGQLSTALVLSDAVDLHAANNAAASLVMFRKTPPKWNSFAETPGGRVGPPKALPLTLQTVPFVGEGESGVYSVRATLDAVYAADIASVGERGWLIAAASRSQDRTVLRIFVWNANTNRQRILSEVPLPAPPSQVIVKSVGDKVMSLVSYPGPTGESVSLLRATLPPVNAK